MYHDPVLLEESIEGLHLLKDGLYVDVTFGGGGHSRAILNKLEQGRLLAFDQDLDVRSQLPDDPRFTLIEYNFSHLKKFLRLHQALPVDGLLADLGVSSHQFDQAQRGFSFRFDAPLDLRMDVRQPMTAQEVLTQYSQDALADVFFHYGELYQARRIAAHIVKHRELLPIVTTGDLVQVLKPFTPRGQENKFLAQLFQALRIEVNQEMEVLESLLNQCVEVIQPGGRLVVISYHSLEDRMIKNFIRSGNIKGELNKDFYGHLKRPFVEVNRKVIIANPEEISRNNRARSAKLRIAERIHED